MIIRELLNGFGSKLNRPSGFAILFYTRFSHDHFSCLPSELCYKLLESISNTGFSLNGTMLLNSDFEADFNL
jgi:hypothetical protein